MVNDLKTGVLTDNLSHAQMGASMGQAAHNSADDDIAAAVEPHVRLVVVHPSYKQTRSLLALLRVQMLYVRLRGSHLTSAQILAQVKEAEERQRRFLADTNYCVLDECDRADEEALAEAVAALLDHGRGRVVLISRTPIYHFLRDPRWTSLTRVYPLQTPPTLPKYRPLTEDKTLLLEVNALGHGRIHVNGRPVVRWEGSLPRALFYYFIDRGIVTRSEIFASFWPALTVKEATNVFHVTKKKMNEILLFDVTQYRQGFYTISPDIELQYDVVLFMELLQQAESSPPERAVPLLQAALALYRDDFLSGLTMSWVTERRNHLKAAFDGALASLAAAYEALGDVPRALGCYLRAMHSNPHREDLAHACMRLYHGMGKRQDALNVFQRVRSQLMRLYGILPGEPLITLAEQIKAEL